MILECKNLCKNISKKEILKDISFNIDSGDLLGFIGPNGAGKTTTIKLILGLQSITSGTVTINGYNIKTDFEKAIERVGTIVENPDLYMYMSGYKNLKMIARMYQNISEERIQEVIKLVNLENRIKDKVSKYSLGMRQRLGIAQAILHKPDLLILDEPTNGLDPEGIKQLRDLLTKLAKEEHMGILISSHNLAELETFCTKVVIIQNGKIIESSSLEDAKKVNGKLFYNIEVDSASKAKEVLENAEKVDEHALKIQLEKEKVPETIKKLVEADIKIYEICEDQTSLEDAFLKKTGGNVID